MATPFLPYDGSKAKFVLQFKDNGGGAVQLVPLRPVAGVALPTFTRAAATATTVGANGLVIKAIAANVARSWYDPTSLEFLGYLAEGARTNLCLQSEDFSSASWTSTNTVTANSDIAPDGTLTADSLNDNSAAAVQNSKQVFTVAQDSTSYTFSAFVKKTVGASFAGVYFEIVGGTSVFYGVVVNTLTGAITANMTGSSAGITSTSKGYPNSWRITVTGANNNTASNTTLNAQVFPAWNTDGTAGSDVAATGANVFWGAQLENAAFASTYIPTTTASVTRNADVLTYATSPWYNAAVGTGFLQGRFFQVNAGVNESGFAVSDGSTNNRINFGFTLSGTSALAYRVTSGGVASVSAAGSGTVTANTTFKVASAYGTNDFQATLNGVSDLNDTSVTPPAGITTAFIGVGEGGSGVETFGTISSIGYWSERLSNNDLLYITTNDVDFTVFTPAPSGGSSQTNIPAAFHARGQSDEQKRRSRVKFGLEKEVEKVIERVAENQVERQERDAQKRYEQLTRELEISGIEYQARYLELLNVQRERLIEARAEEVKKEIQAQADIESLVQSGQQAVDEHYSKIAQQLEQFAADSAQVNQQFIQMLQTFDHEYRAELLRYVPADLLRRRR